MKKLLLLFVVGLGLITTTYYYYLDGLMDMWHVVLTSILLLALYIVGIKFINGNGPIDFTQRITKYCSYALFNREFYVKLKAFHVNYLLKPGSYMQKGDEIHKFVGISFGLIHRNSIRVGGKFLGQGLVRYYLYYYIKGVRTEIVVTLTKDPVEVDFLVGHKHTTVWVDEESFTVPVGYSSGPVTPCNTYIEPTPTKTVRVSRVRNFLTTLLVVISLSSFSQPKLINFNKSSFKIEGLCISDELRVVATPGLPVIDTLPTTKVGEFYYYNKPYDGIYHLIVVGILGVEHRFSSIEISVENSILNKLYVRRE